MPNDNGIAAFVVLVGCGVLAYLFYLVERFFNWACDRIEEYQWMKAEEKRRAFERAVDREIRRRQREGHNGNGYRRVS